jgi:hypothetical protein
MPCLQVPTPALPELPSPLSIDLPELPSVPSIGLCCKLPIPPIPPIPIAIPALILNSAVIALLNGYIKQATDYINSIPAECPLE